MELSENLTKTTFIHKNGIMAAEWIEKDTLKINQQQMPPARNRFCSSNSSSSSSGTSSNIIMDLPKLLPQNYSISLKIMGGIGGSSVVHKQNTLSSVSNDIGHSDNSNCYDGNYGDYGTTRNDTITDINIGSENRNGSKRDCDANKSNSDENFALSRASDAIFHCDDVIDRYSNKCSSRSSSTSINNTANNTTTTTTTTITTAACSRIGNISSDANDVSGWCGSHISGYCGNGNRSGSTSPYDKRIRALGSNDTSTNPTIRRTRKTIWWRFLVTVIYTTLFYILTSTTVCLAARQEASNCTFPQRWEGSWFLSGNQQPVSIRGSTLSFRGKCVASDGDKFLIVDDKGCHRCLVIYEKHKNVLQYKESECEGDNMYMDQSNPAAMPVQQMRSILKSDHRGGAHPNTNGHARLLSSSDQYLMRSNDDINDCPPDYCKGRETLQNLCEQIAGDALLYSLFKENAEPVKCPLRGPFSFTYNRGHGECKNPVSNIESCTEDSRLLLSFQACPDVSGTESTVEELTCLATWKDGNSRYLVGLVSHHHAVSNEERYRCFVYEKIISSSGSSRDAEYKLAQSGDATCNGLDSAEVGSRIMTLRKAPPAERCDFPAWFKGPKHWHALMGNAGYIFHQSDGSMHITKSSGYMETRALCEQINKQTQTELMAVVHYTTGCQSGFMCMMFYRRDTHVAEIQMGTPASRLEDACAPDHFDIMKLPYITLLASNPESQACPMDGLYRLKGAVGPPYITSRHKRNHNNKGHNHSHHHHEVGHRRHSSLSFRNSEDFDEWRMQTRGIPNRSRRETSDEIIDMNDVGTDRIRNNLGIRSQPVRRRRAVQQQQQQVAGKAIEAVISTASSNSAKTDNAIGLVRHRRDTPGCVTNYNSNRQLLIGCSQPNVIEVRPQCNEDGDEVYTCHGSWTENTTVFIIAKHAGSQHGVCISYRPLEGTAARLIVGDACYRGSQPPPDHHLSANLTIQGECSDTNSSSPLTNNWILIYIIAIVSVVLANR